MNQADPWTLLSIRPFCSDQSDLEYVGVDSFVQDGTVSAENLNHDEVLDNDCDSCLGYTILTCDMRRHNLTRFDMLPANEQTAVERMVKQCTYWLNIGISVQQYVELFGLPDHSDTTNRRLWGDTVQFGMKHLMASYSYSWKIIDPTGKCAEGWFKIPVPYSKEQAASPSSCDTPGVQARYHPCYWKENINSDDDSMPEGPLVLISCERMIWTNTEPWIAHRSRLFKRGTVTFHFGIDIGSPPPSSPPPASSSEAPPPPPGIPMTDTSAAVSHMDSLKTWETVEGIPWSSTWLLINSNEVQEDGVDGYRTFYLYKTN